MTSESDRPAGTLSAGAPTESLVIHIGGQKHDLAYEAGDTILGALRRAGLKPPYNCQAGSRPGPPPCATTTCSTTTRSRRAGC